MERASGVFEFAKYSVKQLGEFILNTPNLVRESLSKNSDALQRREYKLSVIKPYVDVVPIEVVEVILDLDLLNRDMHGRTITSLYESRLKHKEVQEIVNKYLNS